MPRGETFSGGNMPRSSQDDFSVSQDDFSYQCFQNLKKERNSVTPFRLLQTWLWDSK